MVAARIMEFLRGVEDDLRTLSGEARKKHAVVKDAAERGVLRLRRMREEYARSMRVESAPSKESQAPVDGNGRTLCSVLVPLLLRSL